MTLKAQDAAVRRLFDELFPAPSFHAWKAAVSAVFGLPVSEAEADLIRRCTERATTPRQLANTIYSPDKLRTIIKSEYRNPKQTPNAKEDNSKIQNGLVLNIASFDLNLFRISDFELRISI